MYQPWRNAEIYRQSALILKEEEPFPPYVQVIIDYVSQYEDTLRDLWEKFKQNPTIEMARQLGSLIKEAVGEIWRSMFMELLNIDWLPKTHYEFWDKETRTHYGYIDNSLVPDLIEEIEKGRTNFLPFDYRVIFLYAGALWSFGFSSIIRFEGYEFRKLTDLYVFAGPDDENTCEGERGCSNYVDKVFTVAEIINQNIIPGKMKCLMNCRHMLLPVT